MTPTVPQKVEQALGGGGFKTEISLLAIFQLGFGQSKALELAGYG